MDVTSWTIKKAVAEELMLLNCGIGEDSRVPWNSRRSNQSILRKTVMNIHWNE